MSDHWDFYFSSIDDEPASVFMDLGIRGTLPIENLDHFAWLRLYMKSPRSDGLSSTDESEALYNVEDALAGAAQASTMKMQYVGRCTSAGTRDFYFYSADGPGSEALLQEALSPFSGYEFETGSRPDADWEVYIEFIYPTERERQGIENRRVLDSLADNGDRAEVVREVCHWIYFREAKARNEFAAAVTEKGYRELSRVDDDESPSRPFGITICHRIDVLPATIDTQASSYSTSPKRTKGAMMAGRPRLSDSNSPGFSDRAS